MWRNIEPGDFHPSWWLRENSWKAADVVAGWPAAHLDELDQIYD
jgi:hypothetical protein